MNSQLHELIKIFNTLQTTEDRAAFQAQWKAFLSNLNLVEQRLAIQTLQEAILANLVEYRQDLELLTKSSRLNQAEKDALHIPSDWFKPDRLTQ